MHSTRLWPKTLSFEMYLGENALATDHRERCLLARGGEGGYFTTFWVGPLGPWNPYPIPELVQVNFATLYQTKLPKSPLS